MGMVLLAARLFLAFVFGVAAVAKAVDLEATRNALVSFGVAHKLATPLRFALPLAEFLVAVALLPASTAWLGSTAALAFLLIFAGAIALNLAKGQSPDCNCFGQIHSKPVNWSTFARNLALAAVAGFLVVEGKTAPGLSAVSWIADLRTAEIAGLVLGVSAVALLATSVAYVRRVLRQQSTILEKIETMKKVIEEDYAEPPIEREEAIKPAEGLPVGSPALDFSLPAIGGDPVSMDDLLQHGNAVALLFVSPNCVPCEALFPLIEKWQRTYDDRLTIVLISKGSTHDNQRLAAKYRARNVLVQDESALADDYRIKWTPAAVIISRYGRIASPVAYGVDAITALVSATGSNAGPQSLAGHSAVGNSDAYQIAVGKSDFRVGDIAPHFSIPDVMGAQVSLSDFVGVDTLLLFWDPGCPWCRKMSDDLLRWEQKPPRNAPQLVFVASGELDKIRSESRMFKSRFLYDSEFEVPALFGTSSTPSAVLIDREGRIASSLAKGLPNVLALAGIRKVELPIASVS